MSTGWMRRPRKRWIFTRGSSSTRCRPSNFVLTNPEVLRKTAETGGENLLQGLNNLLTDLERGKGKLPIKMTDMDAFKLGENIARVAGQGRVSE